MRSTILPLALLAAAACSSAPPASTTADVEAVTPVVRAAATITEDDIRRRIGIIADDSMLGRDTPSPGLEKTAAYVASQFERFGLRPGGGNGTYFQRYEISRRRLDAAASYLAFTVGSTTSRATFGDGVRLMSGIPGNGPITGPVYLIGGKGVLDARIPAEVDGRIVLLVLDFAEAAPNTRAITTAFGGRSPLAVVVVSNRDPAAFGRLARAGSSPRPVLGSAGRAPVFEVRDDALAQALRAAGVALATTRAGSMGARLLSAATMTIDVRDEVLETASAPNTIGIVEGSDPILRDEYVVYTAHMDHVGVRAGVSGDSIFNGADDDASGTVGVIELAEAFAQPGAAPRRSIIFMTVSGEEKGLWGSQYFSEHPTVPIGRIVANVNIDMIGRNWKDTIVVIGKEHSDLGATLARVNAAHAELRMTAIDDLWPEENFYFRSDHFNFARKGVPVLFFFNGTHPDYHQPSDSPEKIDAEKEARIVRLLFHLGQEIGNAAQRPQWNEASRRRIVEGAR